MMQYLGDPVIIISAVVAVIGLFVWWRFRRSGESSRLDERTSVFVFNRNGYQEIKAKTFDGLVTYGTGGFVEDAKCILPLFFGRSGFMGSRNPNSQRGRVNVYITRPGDAAPLDFAKDNFEPDQIARDRFDAFSAISVEREVNRGKLDAGKAIFSDHLIAIAAFVAVIMAVVTWSMILILPLTPLTVKSADSSEQIAPTQIPGQIPNQPGHGAIPTPFVPVNFPKT